MKKGLSQVVLGIYQIINLTIVSNYGLKSKEAKLYMDISKEVSKLSHTFHFLCQLHYLNGGSTSAKVGSDQVEIMLTILSLVHNKQKDLQETCLSAYIPETIPLDPGI